MQILMKAAPITDHSIRNTIMAVLSAAVLFTLLSFLLFIIQVKRDHDKISGQVLAVSASEIIIVDARGQKTILQINEDTIFNQGRKDAPNVIEPGMFIRSGGQRISDTTFIPDGIRIIKKP